MNDSQTIPCLDADLRCLHDPQPETPDCVQARRDRDRAATPVPQYGPDSGREL